MSGQNTPAAVVPSRVVVTDTKLMKYRRKCTLDPSLPQIVTKTIEVATPSSRDKGKVNVGAPQMLSWSVPCKRKQPDEEFSQAKRFKESHDSRKIPMYKGYQLLGDSQFVRFADKLLATKVEYSESLRRIGYCVSGQKIEDLRTRVKDYEFGLHTEVIVLIGTNDIVYRTDYQLMCQSYNRLLLLLKQKCSRIILLTIPPVPKLERRCNHWKTLQNFNNFILEHGDDDKIGVIDLCSIFISYCNTVSIDYFEKVYLHNSRTDLVHLNEKGFKILQFLLDLYLLENGEKTEMVVPVQRQLF